ncbi:MAG: penicillin-binding protein activator LpoB [Betaproteobacteria bacterium]|nr:penicillin-binding protein activator LpoB [Betaproteobacteria bacterium]
MNRLSHVVSTAALGLALLGLGGCASTRLDASPAPRLASRAVWSVAPPVNNTVTPYAAGRVQSQLAALLSAHGVQHVLLVPPSAPGGPLPIDNGTQNERAALAWASRHQARYALLGSVDEWEYKIGLDGQPAVGFTLRLVDLKTGGVVWSGAASASGGSREGLAVLSQGVLNDLINRLLPAGGHGA